MGYRVNKITISLELYVEFEGTHTSTFSYVPADDDALAALACAKNDQILDAAISAPTEIV